MRVALASSSVDHFRLRGRDLIICPHPGFSINDAPMLVATLAKRESGYHRLHDPQALRHSEIHEKAYVEDR